ncbi:MAG: YbaN family protein [Aquimonas sp.]|nr:YbaN family protein [Aquimonas sp.]
MVPAEDPRAARGSLRWLWWLAAWIAFGLGLLGVLLPGLPTVPFMLLAAGCAARGSPRLRRWLEQHPSFGPALHDWEANGAVSRRAKRMAVMMMTLCSLILLLVAPLPAWLLASACMATVAVWLWRRPEA